MQDEPVLEGHAQLTGVGDTANVSSSRTDMRWGAGHKLERGLAGSKHSAGHTGLCP